MVNVSNCRNNSKVYMKIIIPVDIQIKIKIQMKM